MSKEETDEIVKFFDRKIAKFKKMSYSELKKERERFLKSRNISHIPTNIRKLFDETNFKIISSELKRYQYALDAELKSKAKVKIKQ